MNLRTLQENDDSTTIIRLHHASPYLDLLSSPILKCHRSNIVTLREVSVEPTLV